MGPFERINRDVVQELSFVDQNIKAKTRYYYVTRAVDKNGKESVNSNLACADVP
jgi:predicted phage tail protein